jgi:hypothetical protein
MAAKKNRTGPDSEYSPKLAEIARDLAKEGLTVDQICERLHIHINTFYKWRRENDEFKILVQEGRDSFDTEHVEKAMLEDAVGCKFVEKTFRVQEDGSLVEVERKEKWNRNFQAQSMWLRNRNPQRWRDAQEVVITEKELEDKLIAAEKRLIAMREKYGESCEA